MAIQEIQVIDPFLDSLVQHLATSDPKLHQALTAKKTITLDLTSLFGDVVVHSLKTALIGQRVWIDGTNGVQIYDALNNLTVQLNGSALILKTAVTGERVEIDPINGIRIFNSSGVLQSNFHGATVTLPNSVILTQHLIDDAVTTLKLAADAVTAAKIAAGAVGNSELGANAVQTTNIADNQITTPKLVANVITSNELAANSVIAGKIQALAVVAGKLDTDSVTTANLIAGAVTAVKISVGNLSAISADLGTITAGSVDAIIITASSISGTIITGGIIQTNVAGNFRCYMDNTNGFLAIDSSDVAHVQILPSVYAGILVNGLRSIDTNDIFLESQDQSCQLFVSQAAQRVSFVAGSVTRGYFDNQDGSGAGNQPTSLVVRVNGSLQRVNRASSGGFLYI